MKHRCMCIYSNAFNGSSVQLVLGHGDFYTFKPIFHFLCESKVTTQLAVYQSPVSKHRIRFLIRSHYCPTWLKWGCVRGH